MVIGKDVILNRSSEINYQMFLFEFLFELIRRALKIRIYIHGCPISPLLLSVRRIAN
jgi:hypothetical protein